MTDLLHAVSVAVASRLPFVASAAGRRHSAAVGPRIPLEPVAAGLGPLEAVLAIVVAVLSLPLITASLLVAAAGFLVRGMIGGDHGR